jgi:hypothetical protein
VGHASQWGVEQPLLIEAVGQVLGHFYHFSLHYMIGMQEQCFVRCDCPLCLMELNDLAQGGEIFDHNRHNGIDRSLRFLPTDLR